MTKNTARKDEAKPTVLRRIVGLIWQLMIWAFGVSVLLGLVVVIMVPVYVVVNPTSTLMVYRQVTGQPVVQHWRDIDEISDRLKVTLIMSEDGQFCRHHGIDLGALRTEINSLLNGEGARGASTLTMQVARNLFLWQGRSYLRKVLEIPIAAYIDLVMPKQRIAEIYLNIAEWGPSGEFGVEAGVRRAFGIDADALSWDRAGLMVAALPNPLVRDPKVPSERMRRVGDIITTRAQTYWERTLCVFDGREPAL